MPSTSLRLIPGKRLDEQFTVQCSLATLKANVPASYFTPHLELITDGKAVGEAIRVTGPNLIFVRFPENPSGYPVSFALPKEFLIPVTCRPLVRAASMRVGGSSMGIGGMSMGVGGTSVQIGGTSPCPLNGTFSGTLNGTYPGGTIGGTSSNLATFGSSYHIGGSSAMASPILGSTLHSHHNKKDHHDHLDLHQELGDDGEPSLCVVCGRWDETHGPKRKSGHKCHSCVGQKSLDRLRKEFQRLLASEENEDDDVDVVAT